MTDIATYMKQLGQNAKSAARTIAKLATGEKNNTLHAIAKCLEEEKQNILAANQKDILSAEEAKLDSALIDRLKIDDKVFQGMIDSLHEVASLPDPVGEVSQINSRPSGIQVGRMRVPLGVIGIIYESRPNVTIEAASLCLKAGNAVILRGGKEAKHSNLILGACIQAALKQCHLPPDIIQVVETTDRAAVGELIQLNDFVDVIVPRGGKGLIERISKEATIPVIKHLHGVCHVYIDSDADVTKALSIAFNAKTQRYGTCNTMETLLVAKDIAEKILPQLCQQYEEKGVELRGCDETCAMVKNIKPATEADWSTEYLAPILSIKLVQNIDEAINHIEKYSSSHTESIVTQDYSKAQRFLREVDSSSVMVNASTRFADGFEYGLGAEIGISTNKLHARGPVGLEGLTTQKFIVYGDGHIR